MKKIGGLIKRHKVLFVFCVIAFVAIMILLITFLRITINTSGRYGDRLDGIEEVEISKDNLSDISSKLKENEEVEDANLRVQGKVVYIDITFTSSTTMDKGKEIASGVLSEFGDDELEFYDFNFVLSQETDGEDTEGWVSIGAKNSKDAEISWIRS